MFSFKWFEILYASAVLYTVNLRSVYSNINLEYCKNMASEFIISLLVNSMGEFSMSIATNT
jgi:hypothetical protein